MTSRRLAGHTGKVFSVEFNADATVLASGKYFVHRFVLDITLSQVRTMRRLGFGI